MAQTIESALNDMYRSYGRALLDDDNFLIRRLEAIYRPEWLTDCRILATASQAGLGSASARYQSLGRAPTKAERDRMAAQLMSSPGMYKTEAARAVALYSAMLGWDGTTGQTIQNHRTTTETRRTNTNTTANAGASVKKKRKLSALDIIGIILMAAGVVGIVYGIIFTSQTGISLDMLFNILNVGGLAGWNEFTTLDRVMIFLMRNRFYTLFGGAALFFIPRFLRK